MSDQPIMMKCSKHGEFAYAGDPPVYAAQPCPQCQAELAAADPNGWAIEYEGGGYAYLRRFDLSRPELCPHAMPKQSIWVWGGEDEETFSAFKLRNGHVHTGCTFDGPCRWRSGPQGQISTQGMCAWWERDRGAHGEWRISASAPAPEWTLAEAQAFALKWLWADHGAVKVAAKLADKDGFAVAVQYLEAHANIGVASSAAYPQMEHSTPTGPLRVWRPGKRGAKNARAEIELTMHAAAKLVLSEKGIGDELGTQMEMF